jgi:L-amino acid N-acyltransferase YncA
MAPDRHSEGLGQSATRDPLLGDPRFRIRDLAREDAEATRLIYNFAVESTLATLDLEPRSAVAHQRWIEEHLGIHTCLVAEYAGRVIGFASISPFRPRAGYSSSVEDSIYVAQEFWGRGVGRVLLGRLMEVATQLGFHTCIAHVVASHEASLRLHLDCGFRLVGVQEEVGRKFGVWVDVAILQRMLEVRPRPRPGHDRQPRDTMSRWTGRAETARQAGQRHEDPPPFPD